MWYCVSKWLRNEWNTNCYIIDIAGDKLGKVTSGTVQRNQEEWQQSDIEGSLVEILRDVSSHPPTEVQVINNGWDYGESFKLWGPIFVDC